MNDMATDIDININHDNANGPSSPSHKSLANNHGDTTTTNNNTDNNNDNNDSRNNNNNDTHNTCDQRKQTQR